MAQQRHEQSSCARPSGALALHPRQREPAARRPTLRATISQRRWQPPLRPPQWRVLGFQHQAGAARTVHSQNGTRPRARRRIGRMRVQKCFVGHGLFPFVRPYGWAPSCGTSGPPPPSPPPIPKTLRTRIRPDEAGLSRLCPGSYRPADMRRGRRGFKHAMADEPRGEGEG